MDYSVPSTLYGVLLAVNLAAFAAFAVDKHAAQNGGWRISETMLLSLAALGGSLGALIGQQALRHKTRKQPFRSTLAAIALLHIGLGVIVLNPVLLVRLYRSAF